MNWEVFITCAVTGAGDTTGKSERVPITPAAIAESAIEAAKAGAAIAHIHVRDPETGRGSRDPRRPQPVPAADDLATEHISPPGAPGGRTERRPGRSASGTRCWVAGSGGTTARTTWVEATDANEPPPA